MAGAINYGEVYRFDADNQSITTDSGGTTLGSRKVKAIKLDGGTNAATYSVRMKGVSDGPVLWSTTAATGNLSPCDQLGGVWVPAGGFWVDMSASAVLFIYCE